ncbi:MAG: TonB-dependent receptor domain-containing protein [Steroidobacteraceae bacterium]
MSMKADAIIRRAVRTALLTSGAIAVGMTQRAQAADAPAEEPAALQEVVVTGSRIAAPQLESVSPITAINAEEVRSTGVTRVEDLLNSLPQVVADQGSGISMGSSGVANLNLRGLGAQRTLVLINGRRLMGGDPGGGSGNNTNLGYASAGDVNQIPVALVERVDVLTGGASATYGADAVAGVVNFVMNDHFEGVRVDANFGIYNHSNHNPWINGLEEAKNNPSQFPSVTGTNWDGQNKDITLIMGHNFADGAGNFEGYLGYRRNSPITADHRDHSACVLTASFGSPYSCSGSSNSAPTVIAGSGGRIQVNPDGTLNSKVYNRFNYAASHYLQRIDERYTAGFFGHLKFSDKVEAYTEFMFMDDDTRGNYAPAGLFIGSGFSNIPGTNIRDGNYTVNCGPGAYGNAGMNPYLTADEFGQICSPTSTVAQYYDPVTGDAQLSMARRNIEGGPRQDEYSHTAFRGVFGARGELTTDWNYDASFTYGYTRFTDFHNNDTSSSRMQNAMLAVRDPTTGQIVCRGGQTGCVPWNIWQPALGVDPASLSYFSVPGLLQGASQEGVATAFVNGDLTNAGIKLPTSDEGLKIVFGGEYRRETIQFRPDEEQATADLSGSGFDLTGYEGAYHVWEGFTEMRMSLAKNQPGIHSLDVEGKYRYSKYNSGGAFSTNTYEFGLTWAPIQDVRLRASYNRAVRAPNLAELLKGPYVTLDSGTDLCGPGTQFTAAQCALTGLSPTIYNDPNLQGALTSAAGQYNGQLGGSTKLQPEVGKTTNVGIVFTPGFLPGFSATVDYTDIKMSGVITTYGPNLIQTNCIADPTGVSATGETWCSMIHRDVNGTLWQSPQGYTADPLVNLAGLQNKSIDTGLAYRFDMGSLGKLRSRLDGTYLLKLITTPGGGAPYDCAGRFGPSCAPETPKWRHRLSVDWDTPLGLSAGATWRFIGSATNTLLDPNTPDYGGADNVALGRPDARIPTISYIDLRASYTWNKVTLRAGVNNVLDKDPPIIDTINSGGNSIFAESNTYPSLYDTAGRFLFLNATVDF